MESKTTKPSESLADAEKRAIEVLDPELKEHGLLSQHLFNFIGRVVGRTLPSRSSDMTKSRKVGTLLLLRLRDDLRCASLLALRGYPVQACVLGASIFEAAFTIAAIDSDDAIAQEWIDHPNPNRPFKSVPEVTETGLRNLGVPNPGDLAERRYVIYRQLCMPKHLNPLLQQTLGFEVEGRGVAIFSGPYVSEADIRLGWFALEHAAGLAFLATSSFLKNHVPRDKSEGLVSELGAIEAELTRLNLKAAARWGTGNPFPEHWKL